MDKKTTRQHKRKPGLFSSAVIYCAVLFAVILALGFLMRESLTETSRLAADTRDKVLPAILERQRVLLELERISRFAELVHRSEDPDIRQQCTLAARTIAADPGFKEIEGLNPKVMAAYRTIERLSKLCNKNDILTKQYEPRLLLFMPGTKNHQTLGMLPEGTELIKLLFAADRTKTVADLNSLESRFNAIAAHMVKSSAPIGKALKDAAILFSVQRDRLELQKNAGFLRKQINKTLGTIQTTLSAEAALTADNGFTSIAENAEQATITSFVAAGALTLFLISLLYLARRHVVVPITRSIEGFNKASQGERGVQLPEVKLRELNNIRQTMERSSLLIAELKDENTALKELNELLENEIQNRHEAQMLMARAKERAESADQAKSNFLAGMSHEIRTPMNTMIGMGELLLETDPTPKQREYIETLQSSGSMMLDIINDVLDFSKIEAGEMELKSIGIDRDQFLEQTGQIVSDKANKKGINFIMDVDEEVPPTFKGDPTRLLQVLVNLIDNGIKFTDYGEVRLVIQHAPLVAPDAFTFAVIDTGIGIPKQAQKRIFHRFAQADTPTARRQGGTGLGLAISQRLVELMGGTLKLESTEGQGAAFHFMLELKPHKSGRSQKAEAGQSPQDVLELQDNMKMRILVAEDSEANRALMSLYFKDTACKLDFAVNGREAIELFADNEYDLILMDIQMPGMDGYEATRRIRSMEQERSMPTIPIVAVTANAFKEDQERSKAAGCSDYLAKPVSKTLLMQCVASHALGKGKHYD